MHHGANIVRAEDAPHGFPVTHVRLHAHGRFAGDLRDAPDHLGRGIAEIIRQHHVIARLKQADGSVAADEAGAAGQ